MAEAAVTTSTAVDNPTVPAPPSSYATAMPSAAPRPGAISDEQFRRLDAVDRNRYTNVRGANGGEWVETSKLPAAPADTPKPAATNGAPTVTADARLQIGEMLLSQDDIRTLMQTKAEADLRRTQIPATAEAYEAKLPEAFKIPEGMTFHFDANNPALADARRWAHANGLSQQQFGELLSFYASTQVADHQMMSAAAQKQLEFLGPNATARVSAIETFIRGFAGDALGGALRQSIFSAKQVLAWEKIIPPFRS
jgi:hypothetical protein